LKNEATDLIDNKGSPLGKSRNDATVWWRKAVRSRHSAEGSWQKAEGGGVGGKPMADG